MIVKPHKKALPIKRKTTLAKKQESSESLDKKRDLMINVNSLLGCISYMIQTLFGISGGICLAIIIAQRSDSWLELSELARDGIMIFGISCCVLTVYTSVLWLIVRLWKKIHESEPR